MNQSAKHFIILVRHSLVAVVSSEPARSWRLSSEGQKKAAKLANKLENFPISAIISSPEPKAVETSQIISSKLNLAYKIAIGFEEHKRENTPYFKNAEDFREAIASLFTHQDQLVLGEETAVQAFTRFNEALNREIINESNENALFVTHGTVMTLFVSHYNPQISPIKLWKSLKLPCALVLTKHGFRYKDFILP